MNEDAPIIGYEKVPRVQQPKRRNCRILYFHTSDNPYGNYPAMKAILQGAARETIKMRAYGIATKAMAGRFPKFNDHVHIIPDEEVPRTGTRYQFIDPCPGRNWFMNWAIVDPRNRITIYREWPCPKLYIPGVGYPGEWAIPSGKKADGEAGDAQTGYGFGLLRYREEILRLEGWEAAGEWDLTGRGERMMKFRESDKTETIEDRYMDSRMAAQRVLAARAESLTLIEEMEDIGMDFIPTAPRFNKIDEGIDLVNTMLDYDLEKKIDSTNEPVLHIAASCENTIYALHEWTGNDGLKGATKDPIDNVRWICGSDLEYLPEDRLFQTKPRSY
jgi:hypothetical protein